MKRLTSLVGWLFALLIKLYPRRFREEFKGELEVVFRDSLNQAAGEGIFSILILCLRELVNLPASLLREFWYEREGKEMGMRSNEMEEKKHGANQPADRMGALIGALPFVLFGLLAMATKNPLPVLTAYPFLVFFLLMLLGLLIGMLKGLPRWTYSYLGWSLFGVWWWSMMPVDSFITNYSAATHNIRFGLLSWIPLLVTIGLALLRARSLEPLRQMVSGAWRNWSLLSLMMYTFGAYAELVYDENHHPLLLIFMAVSTILIAAGAWIFLQSNSTWKQILSLLLGFVAAHITSSISMATWDWETYYGFPKSAPQAWYVSVLGDFPMFLIWSAVLFWPAIVGLAHYTTSRNPKRRGQT